MNLQTNEQIYNILIYVRIFVGTRILEKRKKHKHFFMSTCDIFEQNANYSIYRKKKFTYQGKSLFEILYRLKNFGIGRIVYRDTFMKRYKEPSYYIVTKVFPDPDNILVNNWH